MRKALPVAGVVVVLAVAGLFVGNRCKGERTKTTTTASERADKVERNKTPRPPAKPATISGKVTRKADGSGVAGANVSLAWAELGEEFSSSKKPTIVITTEANGAWIAKDVPPGDYVIAATAKGLLPGEREKLTISSGEQRTGIDFALDAGGAPLRGTVSDVGGGPIQGARVTARKQSFSFTRDAELVALTAADGTYELSLPDGEYRVNASHDDYTPDGESAEIAGKPVTLDFTLIPGAVVRGQVIARDTGKPVRGAIVKAEAERRSTLGRDVQRTAVSDEKGEFVLRGLASGSLELEARGRGYASSQPTVVQVGIGEEVDGIQVFVDGAFSISGRVVKKGTKTGVPGAQVGAFSMGQGTQGAALEPSDEAGAFEIPGIRPGSYMLYAAAEGSLIEIGKNVEVVDRDVTDVIIELSSGVTLSGRVEPAAVASVTLELEGEVGLGNIFEMVKAAMCRGDSDATGAFTLKNAPPGKFKLRAVTRDGRTGLLPVTIAGVDQSGLVVKLEPRASIAGRVVDTNGKPVVGINVEARADDERPMKISLSDIKRDVKSGADGSFKIVGLDAGTYEMRARYPGDWSVFMEGFDKDKAKKKQLVELAAGQEKTGVTVTVEARDGVIRGVVLGTDGKPAADAWVVARRERDKALDIKAKIPERFMFVDTSEPVLTGADGRFTIGKIRPGTYTLIADGPRGGSHGEKSGVKTGDSATVQLASLGTISLKVAQNNLPVKEYDVSCDSAAGHVDRRAVTTDGTYKLERLAPGEYECHVRGDGGTGDGKVTVPAGEVSLAIELKGWGSLTGVVVSVLTGRPVPDLGVVANSEDNAAGVIDAITGKGVKTDANGRFVVEKVGAGKGRLIFVADKQALTNMESHEYEAKEGQRTDLGTIKILPPRVGEAATFGLTTEVKGDVLEVTNVKEGGPAAQAGVQVGDKITALEGQPVKQLGPELAHKLLASGSPSIGQTVKLTLERGVTVAVTAIKW